MFKKLCNKTFFLKRIKYNYLVYNLQSYCNFSVSAKHKSQENYIENIKTIINNDKAEFGIIPIFKKILLFSDKIAIKDQEGEYSFNQIYIKSKNLSNQISDICKIRSSSRVAIICSNNVTFLVAELACWMSGQIAVPLSPKHPKNLLEYYITDSDSDLIITNEECEMNVKQLSEHLKKPLIIVDSISENNKLNFNLDVIMKEMIETKFYSDANAMILYTSGTTSKPKGVVLSHKNILSQLECLQFAWQMNENDCLLHVLPLNHVHGCINALLLPIFSGAKCIMLKSFNSKIVWNRLLYNETNSTDCVTCFMAVPTIYNFLIDEYEKSFRNNKRICDYIKSHCISNIRLMVSGSAPLTLSVFNQWLDITGHKLLERYGMTEIGMSLSNPYIQDNNRERVPGTVGVPLPNVEVRIIEPITNKTLYEVKGEYGKGYWNNSLEKLSFNNNPNINNNNSKKTVSIVGELLVRGPSIFTNYWRKPEITKAEFYDGWFRTGDVVSVENKIFKILGRSSTDIIKTGGHKVSALEIENQLLEHSNIVDVAVVGLPDSIWGQRVTAIIVCKNNDEILNENILKEWCSTFMASYTIPSVFKFVDEIPRNAMGKINKKELVNTFFSNTKQN